MPTCKKIQGPTRVLRRSSRSWSRAIDPRSLVLFLGLIVACTGCYWSRYPDLMETHLELLEQYADKLQHLASIGREVDPQQWGEFVYPLERADEFADIAAKRFEGRESLAEFRRVLEHYRSFSAEPDVLERKDATLFLAEQVERLRTLTAGTRRALAAED